MAERDWLAWDPYDDPSSSSLARRLEVVQRHLAAALDRCPEGTISVLSMCAGQGRDLLGVLGWHHRGPDVGCFTAAQVVAVLHAVERLGDESSTAPTA